MWSLYSGHQGELTSVISSGVSALIYALGTTPGIQLEGNYLDTREEKINELESSTEM